jgi:hypothetical protein
VWGQSPWEWLLSGMEPGEQAWPQEPCAFHGSVSFLGWTWVDLGVDSVLVLTSSLTPHPSLSRSFGR